MNQLRALRRALSLRLTDAAGATGIAANRISLAERGMGYLTPRERLAVETFLRARLDSKRGAA